MDFKSVFAPRRFCKYSETPANTVIAEGIYEGAVEGTYGLQHKIREADGTEVVLNKAGQLNFLLERAGKGALVQVIYLGESVVSKGKFAGKRMHAFEVKVAETV